MTSKLKVKFIYGNEHVVSIGEPRSGPIDYSILNKTTSQQNVQANQEQAPLHSVPLKDPSILQLLLEKTTEAPPTLNSYKSAETLPSAKNMQRKQSNVKKPVLIIQDADEVQFSPQKPKEKEEPIKPPPPPKQHEQAVIRAPTYKVPPKAGGKGGKKEYMKGENTQKYLYSGIPEKDEDEFVGCFGCMRRKPKAYSVEKPK